MSASRHLLVSFRHKVGHGPRITYENGNSHREDNAMTTPTADTSGAVIVRDAVANQAALRCQTKGE